MKVRRQQPYVVLSEDCYRSWLVYEVETKVV